MAIPPFYDEIDSHSIRVPTEDQFYRVVGFLMAEKEKFAVDAPDLRLWLSERGYDLAVDFINMELREAN